jgi:hypothetical protein
MVHAIRCILPSHLGQASTSMAKTFSSGVAHGTHRRRIVFPFGASV